MGELRVVKRMTPELLQAVGRIEDGTLASEEVMLRVGRSGFSIQYLPLPRAEWRAFPPKPEANLHRLATEEASAVFGAWEAERVVGLACVRVKAEGWAEVVDIRVDASCRRLGLGRMLVNACDRFAAEHGAYGLKMEVSEANPVMCQFCEHTGFVLHGLDRMALVYTESERGKPMARRACAMYFYRLCGE